MLEYRLIRFSSWRFVASLNSRQPMELVLLDKDIVKLLGDYADDRGAQSMALAVVARE